MTGPLHNPTSVGNLCVDSVLESSRTTKYAAVLRSESPLNSLTEACSARGLISAVKAREILDSRGNPTVEVDVVLENGITARATAPSGASVGTKEALELRDNDAKRFNGKGVLLAVHNVNTIIADALHGRDVMDQSKIDSILIELDGTHNKNKLGANAIVATSMAALKAAAVASGKPLFGHLNPASEYIMPTPLINVLNGGAHANNGLSIQEFMIVPVSARSFADAVRMGAECFMALKSILGQKGMSTAVGDEGGFAPPITSNREAIELIIRAAQNAGYIYGQEIKIALDVAASELHSNGLYNFSGNSPYTSEQLVKYYETLVAEYDIASIEDGMAEGDISGWQALTQSMGNKIQLVGDDVFVTNVEILKDLAPQSVANSVLIKPNQVGTITETIAAVQYAQSQNYNCIMSHRSGETEDTTIAHLALGLGCNQIKTGSLCRGERTAKYNELLRIEEYLGDRARYDATHLFKKKLTIEG